jgi:hypothetical protein
MSSLMASPPLEIPELESVNRDIQMQPPEQPSIGIEREGIGTSRRLRVELDGLVVHLVVKRLPWPQAANEPHQSRSSGTLNLA